MFSKPNPETQQQIKDAVMLSKQYQKEIEFTLFEEGHEVSEVRYRELKDGKHACDRFLRQHGIDGA